MIRDQIND